VTGEGSGSELWQRLIEEGASESVLWSDLLLPESERSEQLAFSPLAAPELALGIETIYEGYLAHYGRSRLFSTGDRKLALLLGDRLYAQGLVHVSESGSVAVVADLASLLELCARLQAEHKPGDGALWAAAVARLGQGGLNDAGNALLGSGNDEPLLRMAREAAGYEAVERALAVHAERFHHPH
jgi:hypothetical protein